MQNIKNTVQSNGKMVTMIIQNETSRVCNITFQQYSPSISLNISINCVKMSAKVTKTNCLSFRNA